MPSETSAPTTVVGTLARCQPLVSAPGLDSASPSAATFADDWIDQPPSRSIRNASARARLPVATAANIPSTTQS